MKITISCIQFSLSLDLIIFFWILILNNVYLIGDKGIPRGGGFSPCIMVYGYVPQFLGAFSAILVFPKQWIRPIFQIGCIFEVFTQKTPI